MSSGDAVARRGFLSEVKEALAGHEQDYTEAPLNRAIFLLAVPMVLEMCMESLFGIVDIFWVARLGGDATAAVGVTESIMTIVYSVALGVSMSATAMIARRIGEKDQPGASRAAAQTILLGILLSLVIAVPCALLAEELLQAMGATPAVVASGRAYARIMFAGSVSVMLLFLMNAVFRGAGNAAIAMRVLWFGNGINMLLDPLLIYGWGPFPQLGVEGAAWATLVGRSAGVAYQCWHLARGSGAIRLRLSHLVPDWKILRTLMRLSATGMLQFLIAHASWIALVRIIAFSGSAALAGYTIAIRIVIFSLLPSWGLSNAAATLVGQNLGAQRPDRAEQSVWRTGLYNMVFLGLVSVIFLLAPGPLVQLFTAEAEVVRYGVACLRIIAVGYLAYGYGMVLVQAFNGAGDTVTPTFINLGCYWCFQIPLAWLLAQGWGWGANGAFWAVPAAEATLAVVGILLFRRGRWKHREV
jgi:putative MATE family efflux protein